MVDAPRKSTEATSIRVRNNSRRPLSFSCGGKTCRLRAGEEQELPAYWAGSAELQHLRTGGQVSVQSTAKAAQAAPKGGTEAAVGPEAAEDQPAGDAPTRRSARRKEE